MSQMTVEDFEKVYDDPAPVNGHVLIEVVDKDPARKSKGGIIVSEEQMGSSAPYFVVVDWDKAKENSLKLAEGDVVTFTERNIIFFYGREMKKLALISMDKVAAVFHKDPKKKVPIVKESRIIVDN